MITCAKCSKENQDHYKFCLGCGAELPRGQAPKPFTAQTPPQGVAAARASAPPGFGATVAAGSMPSALRPVAAPSAGAAPAAAPAQPAASSAPRVGPVAQPPRPAGGSSPPAAAAPAAAGAPAGVTCPQCGHQNTTNNRFCASCGYNLGALQAAVAAAPAPAATSAGGAMGPVGLTALRADGTEAGSYRLPDAPTINLGRDTGSIFAGDSYLSPRHATFSRRNAQVFVKDEGSLNGVYLKLKPNEPWPLHYDDVFRIGQEIVRFEELKPQPKSPDGVERFGSPGKGYIGRIALVIGRDTTGNAFPIPERGIHCGRERGDVLFSEDGYVSGLHCRIHRAADGKVYLTDVGSSNGTFIRIRAEYPVKSGDILLMGQQLFRVDF